MPQTPVYLVLSNVFLFIAVVLCHFEDLKLKGQYFIDPQWLSDQLAKVVSAKEVKNFASDGMYKYKVK